MASVEHRVWFVTGASSGFGEAIARQALGNGEQVVVTARDAARLDQIVAIAPERVLALSLDVTKAGEADAAIRAAEERFGRIDVLVNNAGYGIVGAIEETPEAELRAQLETNFFGAIAVTRAALPGMRQRGSGAIVMISSMGGIMSFAGVGPYSASKFALEGASEALAQEVAPFGIDVMIVEPGAFRTRFAGSALKAMPAIDAYAGTVGEVRALFAQMDGTQPGDPVKAATAIDRALLSAKPPLRLQLGSDAVDAVRAKAEQVLAELEAWEAVGRSTDLCAASR